MNNKQPIPLVQRSPEEEIQRLNKIIDALMNRAERSMSNQGSDFSLFQTALMLEEKVANRTQALEEALRDNEKINRDLYRATLEMETEIRERQRAQLALSESESRYRSVTEAALDAIITIDEEDRIVFTNSPVETIFGYRQKAMLGQPITLILPPRGPTSATGSLTGYLSSQRGRLNRERLELLGRHQDGRDIPLELSFGEFETGGRRYFTAVARDITDRKRADALREGQYKILELIASDTPTLDTLDALARFIEHQHPDGRASILLLSSNGRTIAQSIAPSLPREYNQCLIGLEIGPQAGSCGTAMYRGKPVIVSDVQASPLWRSYRSLGTEFGFRACWSTPIFSPDGEVLGSLAIYHSQTHTPTPEERRLVASSVHLAGIAIQRSRTEARIRYMAHHDALTGLPNRALLEDRIQQAIAVAKREHHHLAVMLIDLDRFKTVNDSLGHHIGDELLRMVADRLHHCIRRSDTLARLGGDEFVICMAGDQNPEGLSHLAEKAITELSRHFGVDNLDLHIGASIGIALYPTDGDTPNDLLRAADAAMYAAKDKGRGTYQFFTSLMNKMAHQRLMLITQLRQAIEREEFVLYYQPLVELCSGRIVGAEALLRWNHPERGLVSPDQFIPTLEETGLMVTVGEWVLEAACRQNAAWQSAGLPPISLAVNLSAIQFYRSDVLATVKDLLEQYRLEPRWLTLEFTEAVLLEDTEAVIQTMHQLKDIGVGLALDDFGTGYSSLSYLRRFPVNRLKIDRSFLSDAAAESGSTDIITSIVRLSQSLGLISVAEGVETPSQLALVEALGCDEVQGFLFSAPIPADEFNRLLSTGLASSLLSCNHS